MPEAAREAVLVAGTAPFLSFGILKYQDQILELSSQVTQQIKDALGDTLCKNLDFLCDVKEKVMSLPLAFCCTELLMFKTLTLQPRNLYPFHTRPNEESCPKFGQH